MWLHYSVLKIEMIHSHKVILVFRATDLNAIQAELLKPESWRIWYNPQW